MGRNWTNWMNGMKRDETDGNYWDETERIRKNSGRNSGLEIKLTKLK
jgi:hypothetical protein